MWWGEGGGGERKVGEFKLVGWLVVLGLTAF